MSANRFSVCPRCLKRAEAERIALERKIVDSYGKVPLAEYRKLVESLRSPMRQPEENMREDWELGISKNGEFHMSYGAHCEECGFDFQCSHKRQVTINPEGTTA